MWECVNMSVSVRVYVGVSEWECVNKNVSPECM